MWLRIKVRPQSGERDSSFTTTYGGVRYTIDPEPAEFSEEVGKYLIGSFSDFMEIAPEPAAPEVVIAPKPKRVRKAKETKPIKKKSKKKWAL